MYQIDIPLHVARVVCHLPPDVKKSVREALRAIAKDPNLGASLRGDLEGLWKYRVRRYRIVYEVLNRQRVIRVYAIGHRREIYDRVVRPQ